MILRKLNIRNCGVTDISIVGNLMAGGALQDNTKTGVKAEVDIRDNLIPREALKTNSLSVQPLLGKYCCQAAICIAFLY